MIRKLLQTLVLVVTRHRGLERRESANRALDQRLYSSRGAKLPTTGNCQPPEKKLSPNWQVRVSQGVLSGT